MKRVAQSELPTRLLDVDEVAVILNLPRRTLYDWKYRGIGPPVARLGKHLRYDPGELRQWLDEQAAASG